MNSKGNIKNSINFAKELGVDYSVVKGYLQSLAGDEFIKIENREIKSFELNKEGKDYLQNGTPEFRLYQLLPPEGMSLKYLNQNHKNIFDLGKNNGMRKDLNGVKRNWFKFHRGNLLRNKAVTKDEDQEHLAKVNAGKPVASPVLKMLMRQCIRPCKVSFFEVTKGPKYQIERKKKEADLTPEMLMTGSWKTKDFKKYNYKALGEDI